MSAPVAAPGDEAGARPARRLRWLLLPVVLLGAGLAWHWWAAARFVEETDDAYVGGDVTPLAAKVSGYVVEAPLRDNQAVRAGDLLARLDDRDYRAALARAYAAEDAQRAALANLAAQSVRQRSEIERVAADIDASAAEAQRAAADHRRQRELVVSAAVSQESAQRAEATDRTAQAQLVKARAASRVAQQELAVIDTERRRTEAALALAHADVQLAELNLAHTQIRAPFDGVVGNRRVRVGLYAQVGAPLLSLVPARGLWVDANFKEDQLARMRAGMPVTLRVDAAPGREFHGRLASLAPATGAQFSILPPENATGNFTKIVQRVPVRVDLDQDAATLGLLRPGLSAVVRVDTHADDGAQR
ncbi:MAG: hemolysin D [Roseateles depolymerans]|uniref:Hemolysin D n=1 Tax=Roseateles depolymerans TaxID=76731 RepID=A0A2W5DRI8_9BURK|nr:MAG: hemolysin D [Roseateles depolymerans]